MNKVKRAIQSYCKLIIPEANKGIIVTELSDNRWEVIVLVKKKYMNILYKDLRG